LPILTTHEVAEELRISVTKTRALIASGELESLKIGKARRVQSEAVDAYIDQQVAANAERLVDQAVEQGHPRQVTDPAVIADTAHLIGVSSKKSG